MFLDKDLFEKAKVIYEQLLVDVRLKELQKTGGYMVKRNKPTRKGTKIKFEVVKNKNQYLEELNRIIKDGEVLGLSFKFSG